MNSGKIKQALTLVHQYEKKEGTLKAVERALKNVGLDRSEMGVLFNTLNIAPADRKKLERTASQVPVKGHQQQIISALLKAGRPDLANAYAGVEVQAGVGQLFIHVVSGINDFWKKCAGVLQRVPAVKKVTFGHSSEYFPVINILTTEKDQYRLELQWTVGGNELIVHSQSKRNPRNQNKTRYRFDSSADYSDGSKILKEVVEDLLQYEE